MLRHQRCLSLIILAIIAIAKDLAAPSLSLFNGTIWAERYKLVVDRRSDHLYQSIALDGDTAIIGDPEYASEGAAFVYKRSGNNWSLQAKLSIPKNQTEEYSDFGRIVAIDRNTILIASYGFVSRNNSTILPVYIFNRSDNTWYLQTQLRLTHLPKTKFIRVSSVAIAGDTAIVGTERQVYVFRRASKGTWAYEAELKHPTQAYNFGEAVAIDGNAIVVSRNCGAYVFERDLATSRWSLQGKLFPRLNNVSSCRTSVAISGNTVVIGLPGNRVNRGTAHVYDRHPTGKWVQKATLVPNDVPAPIFIYGFGGSVAIDGKTIVIGKSLEHVPDFFTFQLTRFKHAVYIFERDSYTGWWWNSDKLQPQNMAQDWFYYGRRVSMSGDRVLVSAPAGNYSASPSTVYIFERIISQKK
jgi:hypothetical protein